MDEGSEYGIKCPHWDIHKVIFICIHSYTLCVLTLEKSQSMFGQGNVVTNLCVGVSFLFHSVTSVNLES